MESVISNLRLINDELPRIGYTVRYNDCLAGLYSLVLASEILVKSPNIVSDFNEFAKLSIDLVSARKSLDYYLFEVDKSRSVIEENNPELIGILSDYLNGLVPDNVLITSAMLGYLANYPKYVNDSRLSFLSDFKVNLDSYVNYNPLALLFNKKINERTNLFGNLINSFGYRLEKAEKKIDINFLLSDKPFFAHSHLIRLGRLNDYLNDHGLNSKNKIPRQELNELVAYVNLESVNASVQLKVTNGDWSDVIGEFELCNFIDELMDDFF